MAKNMNVKTATFDSQDMGAAVSYTASVEGVNKKNSSGIDDSISDQVLVEVQGLVQVNFNDWDDAAAMMAKVKTEGILVLTTVVAAGVAEKTLTFALAVCNKAQVGADHAEFGVHSCLFEVRSADGTAPVVVVS